MRDGGRIAASIIVLGDVLAHYQPVKIAAREWGKTARYAGAKDRAFVAGLVLDTLRKKNSLGQFMGEESARALVLAALSQSWHWPLTRIEAALSDAHGPGALNALEVERLTQTEGGGNPKDIPPHIQGNFPEWLRPHIERVFGDQALVEMQAMALRAPVDLRVNTLKADMERASAALSPQGAESSALLKQALRFAAPDPSARAFDVEGTLPFAKGWVEVQDAGSQIAAAAANARPGEQVLDFCAGGGGKTLALAAMMGGKGQVFAYDSEARRLSALVPRLQRSGAHNVQLVEPGHPAALAALSGAMDCVFVDAPCTGTGTWRRKPDTKWRVRAQALEQRRFQQQEILDAASRYVRPGGRLVYATCSFLMEENEDQIAAFLGEHQGWQAEDAAQSAIESGLLTEEGEACLRANQGDLGSVRLTPFRAGTDGFFFAVLRRQA